GAIQTRTVRPAAFDRPHRLVLSGTANLGYGFGVGLSYVYQSGTPYAWVVNGDVNGDGQSANDLVFVPHVITDATTGARTIDTTQMTLNTPSQSSALAEFINSQDCLREVANAGGGLPQRGACRNPWSGVLDMRLTWLSPPIKWDQRVEVQWDIF